MNKLADINVAADSIAAPLKFPVFRRIWIAGLMSNLGLLIGGVGAAFTAPEGGFAVRRAP